MERFLIPAIENYLISAARFLISAARSVNLAVACSIVRLSIREELVLSSFLMMGSTF
ncbi:hypothetical protein Z945_1776 [Sulfitobacter noctilucae]|nr:hypothetical protein Z945_1776 [Sulfitobacter noctilucae]